MGLQKSSKLFNLYVFIFLLPFLILASQEAFASSGDIHTYAGLGNRSFLRRQPARRPCLMALAAWRLMPRATFTSQTGRPAHQKN